MTTGSGSRAATRFCPPGRKARAWIGPFPGWVPNEPPVLGWKKFTVPSEPATARTSASDEIAITGIDGRTFARAPTYLKSGRAQARTSPSISAVHARSPRGDTQTACTGALWPGKFLVRVLVSSSQTPADSDCVPTSTVLPSARKATARASPTLNERTNLAATRSHSERAPSLSIDTVRRESEETAQASTAAVCDFNSRGAGAAGPGPAPAGPSFPRPGWLGAKLWFQVRFDAFSKI